MGAIFNLTKNLIFITPGSTYHISFILNVGANLTLKVKGNHKGLPLHKIMICRGNPLWLPSQKTRGWSPKFILDDLSLLAKWSKILIEGYNKK